MPSQAFLSILELDKGDTEGLKAILEANPDMVNETEDRPERHNRSHLLGSTLLHCASQKQSVEFCRLLAEKNPRAARTHDSVGSLPIHWACFYHNIEVTKYLWTLYPESIDFSGWEGAWPLHELFTWEHDDPETSYQTDILEVLTAFLLEHDQGAVSSTDKHGFLPLHLACQQNTKLSIIAMIFNAYPEAIFTRTLAGYTPLDLAIDEVGQDDDDDDDDGLSSLSQPYSEILSFLESQLEFVREAREDKEPDYFGDLPIHRALRNKDLPPVGTIKLMLDANPASVHTKNHMNMQPIHFACLFGNLDFVKCFDEANQESLRLCDCDSRKNFPLHIACLTGKYDVIKYILDMSDRGISSRNVDGHLPIELLLFHARCDRDSLVYVDAVNSLLRADPSFIPFLGAS